MTVITRIAPSPTGFLHLGTARTALFNWLYARRHSGRFRLRIEDTDRARSTQEAVDAILEAMQWLELDWDGEVVYQFPRKDRHAEAAEQLLQSGRAYRCYTPPEELKSLREAAQAEGKVFRFQSPWREAGPSDAPDAPFVVRLKAPREGETVIRDEVQGDVRISNAEADDTVLLRSDGTPTYMLAVVVDDHDMGISHVIRGDDHLTNAARQSLIYEALEWDVPVFAHIPLIHGPDGAKLSKRHGALGVEAYREMGMLPEAMRNYLLRLGWSHGDDEIIPTEQAIQWFDLAHIGRSPARFDMSKLTNLNAHYLREADNGRLVRHVTGALEASLGHPVGAEGIARLERGMEGLKQRAKTLIELADSAAFYVAKRPLTLEEKAAALLEGDARGHLRALLPHLEAAENWQADNLHLLIKEWADQQGLKLKAVAQPLRAALTGSGVSPPVFEVMEVLGKPETLARLQDQHS